MSKDRTYRTGDRVEICTPATEMFWLPGTVVEPPPIDQNSKFVWVQPDEIIHCKHFEPGSYYDLNIPCTDKEVRPL